MVEMKFMPFDGRSEEPLNEILQNNATKRELDNGTKKINWFLF